MIRAEDTKESSCYCCEICRLEVNRRVSIINSLQGQTKFEHSCKSNIYKKMDLTLVISLYRANVSD